MKIKVILFSAILSLISFNLMSQTTQLQIIINKINNIIEEGGDRSDNQIKVKRIKNGLIQLKLPKNYNYSKYIDLTAIVKANTNPFNPVYYGIGMNIYYITFEKSEKYGLDAIYNVCLADAKRGELVIAFRKKELAIMVCKEFQHIQEILIKENKK